MTEHHLRRGEARRVSPQLHRELEALGDGHQGAHAERRRAALQVAGDHSATAPAQCSVQFTWKTMFDYC